MVPILPCAVGIDNFHEATASVFQPRQDRNHSDPPAAVTAAVDIDFLSSGRFVTRKGATQIRELFAGARLFYKGGMFFVLDNGTLFLEDLSTNAPTVLIEDIGSNLVAHEWPTGGDQVFFSDGTKNFAVRAGILTNWGLSTLPAPEVTVVDGALSAGSYLITIAPRTGPLSDPSAEEGGAASPAQYTIDYACGISVSVTASCAYVAFYCSRAEQSEPMLVGASEVIDGKAEFVINSDAQLYAMEAPLFTVNSGPPPTGVTSISSLQAFMLVAVRNAVYRSWPGRPGLFSLNDEFQLFPSTITSIIGLQSGAWVGTASGLYWLSGDSPESWRRVLVFPYPVLPEGAVVPGSAFPELKLDSLVAVFATTNGIVVGTSSGQVVALTQFSYHFPPDIRVSIAYNGAQVKQLLICQVPI